MSCQLRVSLLIGLCALPSIAYADGLYIPGLGPSQPYPYPRPGYSEAIYPPPQYGLFGQPVAPSGIVPRPTYRETLNAFPPAGGRYGGGIVEYVMTGGRPEPVVPQYGAPIGPVYGAPGYGGAPGSAGAGPVYAPSPVRQALPQSGLPDYAPAPPAYYGTHSAGYSAQAGYPAPQAYNAPQPAYNAPQPAYAAPQLQLPFGLGQPTAYSNGARDPYDPASANPGLAQQPVNPVYNRQVVAYGGSARPGTIIIDTPNKFLYLVQPGAQAIRYGIGVGRPGFAWRGTKTISRKAEWPDWTPPKEMLARRPDLPRHMDGGMANPLGARALYLGSSLFRIHGTNEPYTIGTNVSSGCIRMMNQDVIDLYRRVGVGTHVVVL